VTADAQELREALFRRIHEPSGYRVKHRLVVLGDLRLEMRAHLGGISFSEITEDVFCTAPIELTVSGTAVNMAKAAGSFFSAIDVIVKLGNDSGTEVILRYLRNIPASWHVSRASSVPNGYVMIMRDSPLLPAAGRRLLVSGTPTPLNLLSPDDVTGFRTVIEQGNLLFADGYPLLVTGAREAVLRSLAIARQSGIASCLDLVPHTIDSYLSREVILDSMACSDIVIVEARTLSRLVKLDPLYPVSSRDLPIILERFYSKEKGPDYLILRYGDGDMAKSAFCCKTEVVLAYPTGYAECTSPAGFGDRIAAAELATLLEFGLLPT